MVRALHTLSNKDWAMFILRLAVGAIFLFHGTQKWVFWSGFPPETPDYLQYILLFLSVAEPLAAVMVIAGYQTVIGALGLAMVMVAAVTMKVILYSQPFEAWEMDLLLLAACTTILIEGGGALAMEAKTASAPRPTSPARKPVAKKKRR